MKHVPAGIALLTILGAAGCADPSRLDALEANLGRARAEAALRDRKLEWLRWGQSVLAERAALQGSAPRPADLLEKIAALQAENAALRARLDRAERRLDEAHPDAPPRPAHARTLDAQVPYELTAAKDPAGPPPDRSDKAPRRTLDETVPY